MSSFCVPGWALKPSPVPNDQQHLEQNVHFNFQAAGPVNQASKAKSKHVNMIK